MVSPAANNSNAAPFSTAPSMRSPGAGIVFGVFRNRNRGYNDPDLNFFGLTLPVGLPTVETIHGGTWRALSS